MKLAVRLGLLVVVAAVVVGVVGFAPQRKAAAETIKFCWGEDQYSYDTSIYIIVGGHVLYPATYLGACPPGPDMVNLPAGSVVGTFIQNTELNYAPEVGAGTGDVMEAGKTLWVVGMDETHSWYKVVLSGVFLWVPADSMSPNFDDVWGGQPLPSDVAP